MARTFKNLTLPENHVIIQAVRPLLDAAVAQATAQATAFLAELKAAIDAQPLLDILAPYPEYVSCHAPVLAQRTRTAKLEYRMLLERLTTELDDPNADDYSVPAMPTTVVWSKAGAEKYMAKVVSKAEHQYVAYALKLISKIECDGNVAQAAVLAGDERLWQLSVLTVTMQDGSVQRWQTKMIWNVSVLGNIFNQFPTRRLK
ncbi:MAG: hypothetical protein EOO40_00400 [Deltaproteobacteria bacterium]|nr:MAG: hypothetical protein EOO40_00400 [Deltaproteobacteria bacterium]